MAVILIDRLIHEVFHSNYSTTLFPIIYTHTHTHTHTHIYLYLYTFLIMYYRATRSLQTHTPFPKKIQRNSATSGARISSTMARPHLFIFKFIFMCSSDSSSAAADTNSKYSIQPSSLP